MNPERLTVDLAPPRQPSWFEGVISPVTSWVGNTFTSLSNCSSDIFKCVGKTAPIAYRVLITTMREGVKETLPYVLTYLTHEYIVMRNNENPLAFVVQGSICIYISHYIDAANLQSFQERMELAKRYEQDLEKLQDVINKNNPKQTRNRPKDKIPRQLIITPNYANKIKVIAAIFFRGLGMGYVCYGAMIALTPKEDRLLSEYKTRMSTCDTSQSLLNEIQQKFGNFKLNITSGMEYDSVRNIVYTEPDSNPDTQFGNFLFELSSLSHRDSKISKLSTHLSKIEYVQIMMRDYFDSIVKQSSIIDQCGWHNVTMKYPPYLEHQEAVQKQIALHTPDMLESAKKKLWDKLYKATFDFWNKYEPVMIQIVERQYRSFIECRQFPEVIGCKK